MHQALYRSHRPETFESVIGQENIVTILSHQLATDTVNHAYLFCGTRGTGKTTIARLLAKGVNCLSQGEKKPCGECSNCKKIQNGVFLDVIEFDAASHRGIDDIREIRESVNYPPAEGTKKIYIIDEAHMLTTEASNALLKTLEEPPDYVIFILATTEPQKMLQTIISRCIKLDFRRVSENDLVERMRDISSYEGVQVDDDALRLLAANADGSVRDGLSILDQCLASGHKNISRDIVLKLLGVAPDRFFVELTEAILEKNPAKGIWLLEQMMKEGKDVKLILHMWLSHYRSLLICKFVEDPENLINTSLENGKIIGAQAKKMEIEEINDGIITISAAIQNAKSSSQPRLLTELAIVNLASRGLVKSGNEALRAKCVGGKSPEAATELAVEVSKVSMGKEGLKNDDAFNSRIKAQSCEDAQHTKTVVAGKSELPSHYEDERSNEKSTQKEADRTKATVDNKAVITDKAYLTSLWDSVFDSEELRPHPTLKMIKTGADLVEIGIHQYKLIVSNRFGKKRFQEHEDLFNKAISAAIGRNVTMSIAVPGDGEAKALDDRKTESIASDIKEKLNLEKIIIK